MAAMTSSKRMKMADDTDKILCVLKESFLVGIDLAKFDSSDSFASVKAPARLSSSAILKLPNLGMGCFKLNQKLILVGGEKREEGNTSEGDTSEGDTDEVISAEIYECDLYLKNCRPAKIRRLHDPKAFPVVETIAGKIYVLHTMTFLHSPFERPEIVFEVYDPSKDIWEPLPDPNIDCNFPKFSGITCHFVIGNRLFITDGTVSNCSYFDVESGKWNKDLFIFPSILKAPDVPITGISAKCVTIPGFNENDTVILSFNWTSLAYYFSDIVDSVERHQILALYFRNGRLACYQVLDDLFKDFYQSAGSCCFIDSGDGKMCALIDSRTMLFISLFTLCKVDSIVDSISPQQPIKAKFLSVHIRAKYVFCLDEIDMSPILCSAFFM